MEILFQNTDYVILNKPSGVYSIPDHYQNPNNALDFVRKKFPEVFVVHRIDKDTSGCLAFALNVEAHRHLNILFEQHTVKKTYWALVHGRLAKSNGTITKALAPHAHKQHLVVVNEKFGKEAITHYEVLEQFKNFALVQCQIETGRMHQIRVHMQDLGHPILCDPFYSAQSEFFISQIKRKYNLSKWEESEQPILKRLALHAAEISFGDTNEKIISAQAELFKDMKAVLQQLRKWDR